MAEYRRAVISSIVIGLCAGILLSALLIFLISQNQYTLFNTKFWVSLVVVIAIPFCMLVVKRFGFSYFIVMACMIVMSLVISVIYANVVAQSSAQLFKDTTIFKDIILISAIYHLVLMVTSMIIHRKTLLHVDE